MEENKTIKKIKVMVVNFSHRIAFLIAEHIKKNEDMELMPFTSAKQPGTLQIGQIKICQIVPEWHESTLKELAPDILVDFTLSGSESAKQNTELYCRSEIPFIIGILDGNRNPLKEIVEKSSISAVVDIYLLAQDIKFYGSEVVDSVRFLYKHKKEKGKVFSMFDVLKAKYV